MSASLVQVAREVALAVSRVKNAVSIARSAQHTAVVAVIDLNTAVDAALQASEHLRDAFIAEEDRKPKG